MGDVSMIPLIFAIKITIVCLQVDIFLQKLQKNVNTLVPNSRRWWFWNNLSNCDSSGLVNTICLSQVVLSWCELFRPSLRNSNPGLPQGDDIFALVLRIFSRSLRQVLSAFGASTAARNVRWVLTRKSEPDKIVVIDWRLCKSSINCDSWRIWMT